MPRSSIGREVPAGHRADRRGRRPATGDAVPGRLAALGHAGPSEQARAGPSARSPLEGRPAPERALVPADHPAQPGLQRGDARAELVAVQRQPGLEAQGVAGPEPGRRRRRRRAPPPRRPGPPRPARRTRRRPRRCSRCRRPRRCSPRQANGRHREAADGGRLGRDGGQRRRAVGSLDGDHGPLGGGVGAADGRHAPGAVFEALGMTSKRSSATHHTMMSSSTEPSSSSRWVYWARPGPIRRRSLVRVRCRSVEGVRALDPDGAEVAHVEGHGRRCRQARCSATVPSG